MIRLLIKDRIAHMKKVELTIKSAGGQTTTLPETLLSEFINRKFLAYQEPQRKGTQRGEPIGLSLNKYHAALLMLYDIKLKDIAKQIRVSYGLLRKWRTEERFWKEFLTLADEFAEVFYLHIENLNRKAPEKEAAEILNLPLARIKNYKFPEIEPDKKLADVRKYSLFATSAIMKKGEQSLSQKKRFGLREYFITNEILYLMGHRSLEQSLAFINKLYLNTVRACLLNSSPTVKEKRLALLSLKNIEDFLEHE